MEVLWCKANVSAHIPRICGDILYMDALCIHWDAYTHRYINIYTPVKYLCISVCVQQQWEYVVFVFHEFSMGDGSGGSCRSAKKLQAMKKWEEMKAENYSSCCFSYGISGCYFASPFLYTYNRVHTVFKI
jgi:hypothetical protein